MNNRISPPRPRVIVIDDDPVLLGLMKAAFETAGYEVVPARDGMAGMIAFDAWTPDLVVTDLIMPGHEGIEAIMGMRRRDAAVKIIAITGGGWAGTEGYLTLAKELGADAGLAKPFQMTRLIAMARDLLTPNAVAAAA